MFSQADAHIVPHHRQLLPGADATICKANCNNVDVKALKEQDYYALFLPRKRTGRQPPD